MSLARFLPIASLSLWPAVVRAQAGAQEPDSSPPRSVVMSGVVEVPLLDSGIPGASLPVISVMVNGRGPFRFGVETGAGFVAVSREFVEAAGLTRSGGTDEFPEYPVDSITFGGASFRDFKVAALPRSARGVDGVLGLPFFRNVTFTIDYPASRFRVTREPLPAVNGKDILPITRAGPFWALPIDLAGHTFDGVIDTRSTTALSMTPKVAASLPFDGELRVVGRSGGAGIPGADVREGQLEGAAHIGAYTFPEPTLAVRELPPGFPEGPLVGSRVLSNFVVSLDQRNRRIRLVRQGSTTIELPSLRAAVPGALTKPAPSASPNASPLADYAGTYGDRTLTVVDGKLFIQRPRGTALELAPTGKDAFTLVEVPEAKIEFGRDASGKVVEIRVFNQQHQWERVPRDPPR